MNGVFVTGTDTDVGKSWIAAGLLVLLQRHGARAIGMKPVSCGCIETAEGPRNDDALLLMRHGAAPAPPYTLVNRYAFVPPVSPHLAAAATDTAVDLGLVQQDFAALRRLGDAVVVEGAGGWYVPLDEHHTVADLARTLGLPVVLVVGIRLGCLNHALLTCEAITASGLRLAGWVANCIDPAARLAQENIETLRRRLPAPLLGTVPHLPAFDGERIADCLEGGLSDVISAY